MGPLIQYPADLFICVQTNTSPVMSWCSTNDQNDQYISAAVAVCAYGYMSILFVATSDSEATGQDWLYNFSLSAKEVTKVRYMLSHFLVFATVKWDACLLIKFFKILHFLLLHFFISCMAAVIKVVVKSGMKLLKKKTTIYCVSIETQADLVV